MRCAKVAPDGDIRARDVEDLDLAEMGDDVELAVAVVGLDRRGLVVPACGQRVDSVWTSEFCRGGAATLLVTDYQGYAMTIRVGLETQS